MEATLFKNTGTPVNAGGSKQSTIMPFSREIPSLAKDSNNPYMKGTTIKDSVSGLCTIS